MSSSRDKQSKVCLISAWYQRDSLHVSYSHEWRSSQHSKYFQFLLSNYSQTVCAFELAKDVSILILAFGTSRSQEEFFSLVLVTVWWWKRQFNKINASENMYSLSLSWSYIRANPKFLFIYMHSVTLDPLRYSRTSRWSVHFLRSAQYETALISSGTLRIG